LGKLKFDEFIAHYLGEKPGPILCYQTGRSLGQHRGLWFHTIGQRKGLGPLLAGVVHEGPWYIAAKEPDTNTLYVTNNLEVVEKPRIEFRVERINWIKGVEPEELSRDGQMELELKLRHGPNFCKGTVIKEQADSNNSNNSSNSSNSNSSSSSVRVRLEKRDKGIAPGQFAAFYRGTECLGAGVIKDTAKDELDLINDIDVELTSTSHLSV
jgi:tRNA-specific 2-thiouridylase